RAGSAAETRSCARTCWPPKASPISTGTPTGPAPNRRSTCSSTTPDALIDPAMRRYLSRPGPRADHYHGPPPTTAPLTGHAGRGGNSGQGWDDVGKGRAVPDCRGGRVVEAARLVRYPTWPGSYRRAAQIDWLPGLRRPRIIVG